MIAVGNSAPSSSYTVNVRCIQVVQVRCHSALLPIRGVKTTKPSAHPYFGDIVVRRPGVEEIQGIPKTRVLTSIWLGNRAAAGHARAAEHGRVQARYQSAMVRLSVYLHSPELLGEPLDNCSRDSAVICRLRTYTFVLF